MATYENLTPEDRAIVDKFQQELRAWCGVFARALNAADALKSYYTGAASASLATLDAGTDVPPPELAGGRDTLTKEEILSLATYINTILVDNNTVANREMWARAGSSDNLLG